MKKIVICTLLLMSYLTYPEEKIYKKVDTISKDQSSNLIKSLKKGNLDYEILELKENENFLKIEFLVNDKILRYEIYKNIKSYDENLEDFLSDDFFGHVYEEIFEKKYKIIALSPIIESPVYGRWYVVFGENEIIKASGDDFASADTNLKEFFYRLQNLKNKIK